MTQFNPMAKEHGIDVKYHFSPGQCIVQFGIPAGLKIGKHVHAYTHLSWLSSGEAKVFIDGQEQTLRAPAMLTIEAGKSHEVDALTDVVWLCCHATNAHDEPQFHESLG